MIKRWSNFISEDFGNDNFVKKTIMNMFICRHESTNWKDSVKILKSLEFPTSVESSLGHHRGLAIQVLLDTNLEDSKTFCEEIIGKFPETPLIVIAEVRVEMKMDPIGLWYDNDLVEPGRYFDKLVSEDKHGLFIFRN